MESAKSFIDKLPDGIIPPEIAPEPDGNLSFDWISDNVTMLSISVEEFRLVYAGVLGNRKFHGEIEDVSEIPNGFGLNIPRYRASNRGRHSLVFNTSSMIIYLGAYVLLRSVRGN